MKPGVKINPLPVLFLAGSVGNSVVTPEGTAALSGSGAGPCQRGQWVREAQRLQSQLGPSSSPQALFLCCFDEKALLEAGHLNIFPECVSLRPAVALGRVLTCCNGVVNTGRCPPEVAISRTPQSLKLPDQERWETLGWFFCSITFGGLFFLTVPLFIETLGERGVTVNKGALVRTFPFKKLSYKSFAFIKILVSICRSVV